LLLWGHIPPGHPLPAFTIEYFDGGPWLSPYIGLSPPGRLYVRFDRKPLRIGDHVVRFTYDRPPDGA
jgi:hypothetical protein